jgi:anti-sigma regulatory factor (Ser/Thr protein kinase)
MTAARAGPAGSGRQEVPAKPVSTVGPDDPRPDRGRLPANDVTQVHVPALPGHDEIDQVVMAAYRARSSSCGRWLMLAAETAGLASSARLSPDPAPADWGCLARTATCTPGPGAGSVRAARDFTVATLCQWSAAERGQDIAVVVSELLTNALRHALPGSGDARPRHLIRVGLLQLRPCVLCAVADPSTAAPVPRPPGTLAETGRGLHIVSALSDRWGYITTGTGKVVWAMFTAWLTEPSAARYPSAWDQVPGPAI